MRSTTTMTSPTTVEITLTGGNIRNGHFYLRGCPDLFPPDAIGGSRADEAAAKLITLRFFPGDIAETDIAGPPRGPAKGAAKFILRCRGPGRAFFERTGAEEGDIVVITRDAPYSYTVRLKKP